MKLLLSQIIFLVVLVKNTHYCTGEVLFFVEDDLLRNQDQGVTECPVACPADSEPICTSNGFCIKLFDSPCQALYYNCKNNEEYKHIHQQYCEVPRFKNLQPQACFNNTVAST